MTFLGLRSSLLFSSSWWVHVRWTDGLKALPMMMALDALTDIDRADHNALHSANAPTRHRARLQPAQACFAIFSVQCSTWGRRPFMFSPQSTLGRLVRQMIAISLASPPPSDHRTAEFQWAQNDLTKCCWFTKTQVYLLLTSNQMWWQYTRTQWICRGKPVLEKT